MLTYLLGPLLALLPSRWRVALFGGLPIHWSRATFLSGIYEAIGCLLGLVGWYQISMRQSVQAQMDVTLQATKDVPGEGAAYAMGFAALLVFAAHPLSWALAYFSAEGALRGLAAAVTEEAPGTLPLVLLDGIVAFARRTAREARLPRVPDAVTSGDAKHPWDLRVASCRPKPHWKYPLAIRYQDEFFQVIGETLTDAIAERPYVYLLQRAAAGEALRGLENYDPEAVLRGEENLPGSFMSIFRSLRERYWSWRLPLVPDELQLSEDREGGLLEVASCRAKPEWSVARLVLYAGDYYRVEGSFDAPAPRPFGYVLRRLPAGVPGRSVRLYSPDEPLRGGH